MPPPPHHSGLPPPINPVWQSFKTTTKKVNMERVRTLSENNTADGGREDLRGPGTSPQKYSFESPCLTVLAHLGFVSFLNTKVRRKKMK